MIKKVTTLILACFLMIFTANFVFADGKTPPPPPSSKNGNFSKGKFSKNNAWSKNGKATEAPLPNGTGSTGGNRIPISNGLTLLLLGSAIYLTKKVRDSKREAPLHNNIDD